MCLLCPLTEKYLPYVLVDETKILKLTKISGGYQGENTYMIVCEDLTYE